MDDVLLDADAVLEDPVRSWGQHFALIGAGAVLLGLSFPEPGWWWLAHVALAPGAWAAVSSNSVKRLVVAAYGVSLGWWLVRLAWLIPITGGGYAVLAAFMAIYLPLTLAGVRWLNRRLRLPVVVALPMVWVSLEWVRGVVPMGGFCWFGLGHTQAPYHEASEAGRLVQVADVLSEYGVSFLVAMSNGFCVDAVRGYLDKRRWPRARAVGSGVAWAAAIGGAWLYGQYQVGATASQLRGGGRVAVIQTNVPQDQKDRPTVDQREDNWGKMVELTREAVAKGGGVNVVVWPETMVPAALNEWALEQYLERGSWAYQYHEDLLGLAKELGVDLLVGAHASEPAYRRYNSVYLYRAQGDQWPARYDKIHRVPFGEYIPWVQEWPWLKELFLRYLSPYETDYTLEPGRAWTVFEVGSNGEDRSTAMRVATPICFEDVIGRVCRRMVYGLEGVKRVDVLVNLTNDGWYGNGHEGPQHLQMAVLRCVENRVPMARSVNTGISGFIDSTGRVGPVVRVGQWWQGVEGYASATEKFDGRSTVFGRVGHLPVQVLAGGTGLLVVVGYFCKPRSERGGGRTVGYKK